MGLNREPKELKDILNSINNNLNFEEKKIVLKLRQNLENIVSSGFAKSVVIYDLKDGVLRLKVVNSVWKTEIHLRQNQIVDKFNEYLGANIIKSIVLQ